MNAKWQNCLFLSYSNLQPHTIYTIRAQRQHLAAENAKQLLLPVLPPSQDTNKITNQVTATQQEQPSTKQEREQWQFWWKTFYTTSTWLLFLGTWVVLYIPRPCWPRIYCKCNNLIYVSHTPSLVTAPRCSYHYLLAIFCVKGFACSPLVEHTFRLSSDVVCCGNL